MLRLGFIAEIFFQELKLMRWKKCQRGVTIEKKENQRAEMMSLLDSRAGLREVNNYKVGETASC